MLLKKDEKLYYVNTRQMVYLLTKKYPFKGNLDKNILAGINGLISKGVIDKIYYDDKIDSSEWILDLKNIISSYEKKEYYSMLDSSEINKILLLNESYCTRSVSIVRFYSYILSTISKTGNKSGVGYTSLKIMSEETGHNKKTLLSYLKVLSDLELLYIYKSKDFIKFDTGEFVEISHTYGKFKDKDKIIEIGAEHENTYGENIKGKHQKIKKTSSNKNRSYAQKFKYLESSIRETGLIPYGDKECEEIYRVIKKLNEQYKDTKEPKDLSIFENFKFYNQ